MKNYVLFGLDDKMDRVLLICLSYESIYSFCDELQREYCIRNEKGVILLDQLLVTGNGKNRFVTIPFEKGKIDFSKAHVASVDIEIRKISADLLKKNVVSLRDTILTEAQKEMIQNNIAI